MDRPKIIPHPLASTSEKTIGRLSLYRRLLYERLLLGETNIRSHELARIAGGSAAQVRRDLMTIGAGGSPNRGYEIGSLITNIGRVLDSPEGQAVALVGVGNLGRAILAFFSGRRPKLAIRAAFDTDANRAGRLIGGVPCYLIEELPCVVRREGITVGIISVPAAEAQSVADQLVAAGVRGILNFAPVILRVPPEIHVERNDITTSLEKVAYFSRERSGETQKQG